MTDAAAKVYERLLILRCQAGDQAALAELIARYSPALRLYLRKLARQSSADDLLQETWFDTYRKINRLKNPDAFSAWIYRIARDKAYRELRRCRAAYPADQDLSESIAIEEPDFSLDDTDAIRAAMDELPAEQCEVLLLRFVEQMSYEEIAQVIGRPVGTVRSRIHYAKLALREKLEAGRDVSRRS